MFGWLKRRQAIVLDVPGADFCLREPLTTDYASWRDARARNYDHLQPFEPTWAEDALEESAFQQIVRTAQINGARDDGYSFLLISQPQGEVIGAINITNLRRRIAQMATIGYWIAAEYGQAGRMKKAVHRITRFCFEDLNLHRVEAACMPHNEASAAILLGCGFEEEGFARAYLKINGDWRDHRLFGLVRQDPFQWRDVSA